MAYFYDAVGFDDELHDDDGSWHSDWLGLNLRGAVQYARRGSDGRYGSVWYGSGIKQQYDGWYANPYVHIGWFYTDLLPLGLVSPQLERALLAAR